LPGKKANATYFAETQQRVSGQSREPIMLSSSPANLENLASFIPQSYSQLGAHERFKHLEPSSPAPLAPSTQTARRRQHAAQLASWPAAAVASPNGRLGFSPPRRQTGSAAPSTREHPLPRSAPHPAGFSASSLPAGEYEERTGHHTSSLPCKWATPYKDRGKK